MLDKFRYSGDWHVALPDGGRLNMNSEEAADMLLGLLERVETLEAQLRKRAKKRAQAKRGKEEGDGD